MKVTDVKPVVGIERGKASEALASSTSGNSAPKDRVSVSGSPENAAATAAAARNSTAVSTTRSAAGARHAARLQQLEAQVRSGGYKPDPSRVAEQILSDAEVDARLQAMLDH